MPNKRSIDIWGGVYLEGLGIYNNEFRNSLLEEEQPTEDVDELLMKILDAPPQKKRRFDREDR